MGLFDFLKKNKNIITDNGLNLIYSKDNNYLLYAYNKQNGKIEGLLEVFHNPKVSGYNLNYKRIGKVGLVYQEYFFSEGKQNGVFKQFNEVGKLEIYRENLKSEFLDFNNPIWSDKMQTKLIVKDNLEISGNLNKYYENGIIEEEKNYIHGQLVNIKQYYKNGQLNIERCKEGDDWKEHIEYYINGKIKTKKYQGLYINNVFFDNTIWYNTDETVMNGEQIIKRSETEIKGLKVRFNSSRGRTYSETTHYLFINQICFYYIESGSSSIYNSDLSFYTGVYEGVNFVKGFSVVSNNKSSAIEYFESGKSKYNQLNDYGGAMDDFNKSIEINPNFSEAFFNRGILKKVMEDYQGALEDYNKAIELDENSEAYRFRAGIKSILNDFVGAMKDYNLAIVKHPNQRCTIYYNRGCLKFDLEDFKGAIDDFDKSIEANTISNKRWPRSDFYKKRGDCKLKIEDYYGAIEDLNKAMELNPNCIEEVKVEIDNIKKKIN